GEKRVEIEALFEVVGKAVQRRLDRRIILRVAFRPEPRQKCMPKGIAGEQSVQIAAGDRSFGADRAVRPAIEAQHRPGETRPGGDPEMHLVTAHRLPARDLVAIGFGQPLVAAQYGVDTVPLEASRVASRTYYR